MLCQAGLSHLSRASPPSPLSIFDGEGEEVLAHGSWGGWRPDMVQMWCICVIFFGVFPLFCLLTPGVEADEAVFKGVQILHIPLVERAVSTAGRCTTRIGAGGTPPEA